MALRRFLLAFLLVVGLVLAGCSSDDGEGDADGPSGGTDTTDADGGSDVSDDDGPPDQTPPIGANGIKIDDDGNLWVAVLASDELLRVDAQTGEILQRLATPSLAGPDDLVIGDDGTLYWTGFTSGDVGALDPATGDNTELANIGEGANPIAQRDDGTLVVGRAVTGSGLYLVDPAGEADVETLADPGNVNSFSIAPDGTLYAPLASVEGGAAVSIDPDTGEIIDTIAPVEGIPVALRWHDDQLYVLSLNPTGVVFRVDIEAGTSTLFADTGLTTADNLAVSGEGDVFVTGFDQPVIAVFDAEGNPTRTLDIGSSG